MTTVPEQPIVHPCTSQTRRPASAAVAVLVLGLGLAIAPAADSAAAPATANNTFCNPLNLDYGWGGQGHRHSADPVIVLFKDRYYLFATEDVPGYRVSDDLLHWSKVLFTPEQRRLMSDNDRGTYCAPAVAADDAHVYFIRMDRRKGSGRTVPVMRSADPAAGIWEQCGELKVTGDPMLFLDEDQRAWLYHGLGAPTKVFEIDRETWTEIRGSERQLRPAITNLADFFGGYERGRRELLGEEDTRAWLDKFAMLPCQEAAWMTRRDGRYYLQYATPGTVTEWYCDTVMEGDSPTGPFRHVDYAPVSLKVGGFMGSAGHSCVFRDKHGNWWRITTLWIGVHDLFERRLGLFPVSFDSEGRMFTETALGDYPQVIPSGRRDSGMPPQAGWWVQSFAKPCAASTELPERGAALAVDEDCRTWWSAETGQAGEWFQLDLGRRICVTAVQVNFAEQDCVSKAVPAGGEFQQYRLLASDDGWQWRPLSAPGARMMLADDVREAHGPHDDLAFPEPVTTRFLKVENRFVPGGGKFALRDLRVFGPGDGRPPQPATGLQVTRHRDDDRNATLSWNPSPDADGYLIRFGIAPDKLFQTIQVQGDSSAGLTTHALNRSVKYAWRVDAFNANGITAGATAEAGLGP